MTEDTVAVRQELWNLLQQQIETLGSTPELTDNQLCECYFRQLRVERLRQKLEASNSASEPQPLIGAAFAEDNSGDAIAAPALPEEFSSHSIAA